MLLSKNARPTEFSVSRTTGGPDIYSHKTVTTRFFDDIYVPKTMLFEDSE